MDIYSYLSSLPQYGSVGKKAIHYSLDNVLAFSCKIGNPHLSLLYVHVAGTNGKGTVCHQLAAVYQAEKYKVGLFTSPHLERFQERIKINGKEINDNTLQEFFNQWAYLLDEIPLSYFELLTIIALWYFTQQQVDIAIIETGLGGRLDATNIIQSQTTIITSISLDHTDILGNSLEQISHEKAGVIKEGVPVVIGDIPYSCLNIFVDKAKQKNAQCHIVFEKKQSFSDFKFQIPSLSLCHTQSGNMMITQAATKYIGLPICKNVFQSPKLAILLKNIYNYKGVWHCLDDTHFWFYDGAHNIRSLERLFEQMETIVSLNQWTLVIGLMKDKVIGHDYLFDRYALFKEIFYLPIGSERGAILEDVKKVIPMHRTLDHKFFIHNILLPGRKWVMFTGSFYLYSIIKQMMRA